MSGLAAMHEVSVTFVCYDDHKLWTCGSSFTTNVPSMVVNQSGAKTHPCLWPMIVGTDCGFSSIEMMNASGLKRVPRAGLGYHIAPFTQMDLQKLSCHMCMMFECLLACFRVMCTT